MEIRRSYDRLISTMGFPILVRWHLYIESGPWLLNLFLCCLFYEGLLVDYHWIDGLITYCGLVISYDIRYVGSSLVQVMPCLVPSHPHGMRHISNIGFIAVYGLNEDHFWHAKPWIPGGEKSISSAVIHKWRSLLRQFRVQEQSTKMTSQCQCPTFNWRHRSTVVTSQY